MGCFLLLFCPPPLIKTEIILSRDGEREAVEEIQVLEPGRPGWNFLFITYSKTSLNIFNRFYNLKQNQVYHRLIVIKER